MEIIAVIEVQKGRNKEMRTQITQLHNQSKQLEHAHTIKFQIQIQAFYQNNW